MRVGMVCPYSLTIPGGVQMQVLGLAAALRADGHTVQVLAPCDGPPPEEHVVALGKSIPFATNGSVAPIAPDPSCARRTIRALREGKFDVVHLHEPLVPGPAMTSLLYSDVPMVGTFHRSGASRAYNLFSAITRRVGRRLAARVAVSEDAFKTARDGIDGEFTILFNGIDIDRFATAEPWATDNRPTVLFVGRHEPRKGLEVLLEASRSLPADVAIWIAGQGPETEALRARHRGDERMQWLGRVADDELARRLAGADVFCAPSRHGESFGVVLVEAMAAGTAIVASDIAGYRTVARRGEHALLVPPDDPTALAAAITRLLDDPAARSALIDAGRARAAEFAMSTLAARYTELYDHVITQQQ